jgi:hypothetical protein
MYFRPTEANPMTMKVFKTALFEHLAPAVKTAQKFLTADFKDFNFLHVHGALGEQINRAKPGAKIPILKFECFLLSEHYLFNSVGETMEIVIIPASTKSHSTRAVGGSSSLPDPLIRRVKAAFIAEQLTLCRQGKPISSCFDHLAFIGPTSSRLDAISAVVNRACNVEEMLMDAEIVAAEHLNATIVVERFFSSMLFVNIFYD